MLHKNTFKSVFCYFNDLSYCCDPWLYDLQERRIWKGLYLYPLFKIGRELDDGMPVEFSGFNIGKVEDMELSQEGAVLIKIKIPKRHIKWIRSDSVFSLDKPLIGAPKITVKTKNLNSPELSPKLSSKSARLMILMKSLNGFIPSLTWSAESPLISRLSVQTWPVQRVTWINIAQCGKVDW